MLALCVACCSAPMRRMLPRGECFPSLGCPPHIPRRVGAETLSQEPPKLLWHEFRKTQLVWESLKMLSWARVQPAASHARAPAPPWEPHTRARSAHRGEVQVPCKAVCRAPQRPTGAWRGAQRPRTPGGRRAAQCPGEGAWKGPPLVPQRTREGYLGTPNAPTRRELPDY